MGLREEAERIIAEEDRAFAEMTAAGFVEVKEKIPDVLEAWCTGMRVESVPLFTLTDERFEDGGGGYNRGRIWTVTITFNVDGIDFKGLLVKKDSDLENMEVTMIGYGNAPIHSIHDIAKALRPRA